MARTATSVPRSHCRPHTWMRCAEPSFMTEICLVWLLAKSMMARENDIDARSTFMPQPAKRSRSRVSRTREDQSAFIYKRHSLQLPPRARVSARWAAAASESQVSSVNALTLFEKEALTRGAGSVRRWSSFCYFAPHRSDHVQSCRQQGVRERLCHSAPRRWCLGTVIPEDEGRP